MDQARLSVVLLDVNETLFSLASLGHAFAVAGLPPQWVPLWFARVLRDGFAFAATGDFRSFAEVARHALDGLPLDRRQSALVLEAFHSLSPHPDVAEGLELLAAARLRLLTLTVGDVTLVRALFRRAGLDHFLEASLSADTVRRWKPAPEPYQYALHTLGVSARETALIAAHDWDIHGAAQLGLRTGRIARLPASPLFTAADVVAPSLPEVARGLIARFSPS